MSFDDFSDAGREGRRLFCDETSGCVQQQPLGRPPGDVVMRRRRRPLEISLYLAWAISASICWAFARLWPVVPRCVAELFGYTSARGKQGERRKGKVQTPRALQGRKRRTSRASGWEQVHKKGKREWIFRPRTQTARTGRLHPASAMYTPTVRSHSRATASSLRRRSASKSCSVSVPPPFLVCL